MSLNQQDHGDDNWGVLSKGWPQTNEHAYEKWVFANKSKIIPYGSYVLMESNTKHPYLRVESKKDLEILNENFGIVREVILNNKYMKEKYS